MVSRLVMSGNMMRDGDILARNVIPYIKMSKFYKNIKHLVMFDKSICVMVSYRDGSAYLRFRLMSRFIISISL